MMLLSSHTPTIILRNSSLQLLLHSPSILMRTLYLLWLLFTLRHIHLHYDNSIYFPAHQLSYQSLVIFILVLSLHFTRQSHTNYSHTCWTHTVPPRSHSSYSYSLASLEMFPRILFIIRIINTRFCSGSISPAAPPCSFKWQRECVWES